MTLNLQMTCGVTGEVDLVSLLLNNLCYVGLPVYVIYIYIPKVAKVRTYMKNLIHHFPTCCAYLVKKPIGELSLERALEKDTGVFSFFFSSLSSSYPLGQTAVSGNSTLHQ